MSEIKQYAKRDLMAMDVAGNHYCWHVDHMTREKLHSKSDIAAELGWRDMQIAKLTAERDALAAENAMLKDINAWCQTEAFHNMHREFKKAEAIGCPDVDCMHDAMLVAIMHAPKTPATDAYLNTARAEGALLVAERMRKARYVFKEMHHGVVSECADIAVDVANQLRAGEPS